MKKRLFLVAGYDAHGVIDTSLIHLVKSMSEFGDVIFVMDSDADASQLKKIKPYTIYAAATRHGEYDFGSYKRAYQYARDNDLLKNYELLYLVNDSVYGPLYDMTDVLKKLESFDTDAFGLVKKLSPKRQYIQSWFIGCRRNVFLSEWFDKFMTSVKKEKSKGAITYLYEYGFSRALTENGGTYKCILTVRYRGIYNCVRKFYKRGLPFMKKVAIPRHMGAYGNQVLYILNHVPTHIRDMIMKNATRIWGDKYMKKLLTRSPLKLLWCRTKYAFHKLNQGTK